jgi:hypothetical protein
LLGRTTKLPPTSATRTQPELRGLLLGDRRFDEVRFFGLEHAGRPRGVHACEARGQRAKEARCDEPEQRFRAAGVERGRQTGRQVGGEQDGRPSRGSDANIVARLDEAAMSMPARTGNLLSTAATGWSHERLAPAVQSGS